jgi:heam-based aerotactic trancducer
MKVARMHFKIGLEPKWYMGAFQQVQEVITKLVNQKDGWSKDDREKAVLISSKLRFIITFCDLT